MALRIPSTVMPVTGHLQHGSPSALIWKPIHGFQYQIVQIEARLLEGFDERRAFTDMLGKCLAELAVNLPGLLVEEHTSGGRALSDEKHLDLRRPIGKDRSQQPDSARRGALASLDDGTTPLCFLVFGSFPFGNVTQHPLNVLAGDLADLLFSDKGPNVTVDPANIGLDRTFLFCGHAMQPGCGRRH